MRYRDIPKDIKTKQHFIVVMPAGISYTKGRQNGRDGLFQEGGLEYGRSFSGKGFGQRKHIP